MKKMKPLYLLGIAGLGSVLASSAIAQHSPYSYLGLGVGQSQSQIEDSQTTNSLLKSSNSPASFSSERQDTAYKVFGGYQFHKNFALEAGYFNLGKFTYATSAPGGTLNGRYEIEGVNLDLVGTMPLSPKWSALARVGVQHANTRTGFSGPGYPASASQDNSSRVNNMKVGLGLQYEISPSVLLRGEAERFRVRDGIANNGDVNYYSMSLVFPFGRKAPQQVAAVTPPPYVAPPPPPAPIAVVTPPPPPPAPMPVARRVQFSADSLFSFDKAVIRPDGRAALDTFGRELQGARYNSISVEGNTDRLGSDAYNQKLSRERADAVKAYLITNGGIDARKITATGRGETNPETKPEDCKGNKPTPALIACLQPDRRVDVEVTGER
ncbi:OmpA family protein [Rhodoferax sp. AJA081-3]|uniref:OmpA family protein n=1 Tax=Rhodoferax sp. AJA081-3 TaxID=2752316 RepID=UPI001ADF8BF1|nr:OmpA family protein [Rhodoferax sp. AJA081-3]QTN27165.1 OmpA family protein [Rhodoferax sp. AJA081-3]